MEQRQSKNYTVDYVENLPEEVRVELIDGVPYNMEPPSLTHQDYSMFLSNIIYNYIAQKKGNCKVYAAPSGVYLDDHNYLEPDIFVICDKNKLDEKGCHGGPDWVIEIASPSTIGNDYLKKLNKYHDAGVKLYWIVNPMNKRVVVWHFEKEDCSTEFAFGEEIPVDIFPDLSITVPQRL